MPGPTPAANARAAGTAARHDPPIMRPGIAVAWTWNIRVVSQFESPPKQRSERRLFGESCLGVSGLGFGAWFSVCRPEDGRRVAVNDKIDDAPRSQAQAASGTDRWAEDGHSHPVARVLRTVSRHLDLTADPQDIGPSARRAYPPARTHGLSHGR